MSSSYWLPVFAALSLGLAAAFSLEANWLRRARLGGQRSWLYAGLAGLCVVLTVALWLNGRTPPSNDQLAIANVQLPTTHYQPPITDHRSLPPPLVKTNYELGISNDELGIAAHRSPITVHRLPITAPPTRLRIPALKINRPILPVSVQDGAWDVAGLGGNVGLLAGAGQHPGDALAMVFVGHMTFPDEKLLSEGAFAELQYATYGTEVRVEVAGETAVYQVSEISRITPDDVDRLYLADGDSILLLTCTDWNDSQRVYANRLLVRATRVATVNSEQ